MGLVTQIKEITLIPLIKNRQARTKEGFTQRRKGAKARRDRRQERGKRKEF